MKMGEASKNLVDDTNVFEDCMSLFDDIEWKSQMVALREANGHQCPPLENNNNPQQQLPLPPLLMAPQPLIEPPTKSQPHSPTQIIKTINISSSNAPQPQQPHPKRRPGRPKSNTNEHPSWLPSDWIIHRQIRQRGATIGHIDKVNQLLYTYIYID